MGAEEARPLRAVDADDEVRQVTEQLRVALEAMGDELVTDAEAAEAAAVLDALAELRRSDEGAEDERKRLLWGAVAQARADLKATEVGTADPRRPSAAAVTAVERARAAVDEAEAKAKRKLASPGAFRRHVEAKRELASILEVNGFADLDAYVAALDGAEASDPAADREAALAALAEAEAAWEAFLAEPAATAPATPEADALRARAYRVLGRVVDDEGLTSELARLVDRHRQQEAGTARLRELLEGAGIAPGADPVAVATLVLRAAG